MCSTYKQLCLGIVFFYLIKIGGGEGSLKLKIPRGGRGSRSFGKKRAFHQGGGGGWIFSWNNPICDKLTVVYISFPRPTWIYAISSSFPVPMEIARWKCQGKILKSMRPWNVSGGLCIVITAMNNVLSVRWR